MGLERRPRLNCLHVFARARESRFGCNPSQLPLPRAGCWQLPIEVVRPEAVGRCPMRPAPMRVPPRSFSAQDMRLGKLCNALEHEAGATDRTFAQVERPARRDPVIAG